MIVYISLGHLENGNSQAECRLEDACGREGKIRYCQYSEERAHHF